MSEQKDCTFIVFSIDTYNNYVELVCYENITAHQNRPMPVMVRKTTELLTFSVEGYYSTHMASTLSNSKTLYVSLNTKPELMFPLTDQCVRTNDYSHYWKHRGHVLFTFFLRIWGFKQLAEG